MFKLDFLGSETSYEQILLYISDLLSHVKSPRSRLCRVSGLTLDIQKEVLVETNPCLNIKRIVENKWFFISQKYRQKYFINFLMIRKISQIRW